MAPSRTAADASGSGDDDWMEGLSAADAIRQFGVDPNAVLSSDGILRTPGGLEYEDTSSGHRGSLSSESSNSSGRDEGKTIICFIQTFEQKSGFRRSIQQRRVHTATDR